MGDLLFVTAQPDVPYFHWQCEIYLNNFISNILYKYGRHRLRKNIKFV